MWRCRPRTSQCSWRPHSSGTAGKARRTEIALPPPPPPPPPVPTPTGTHICLDDAPGIGEAHIARGAIQMQALPQVSLGILVDLQVNGLSRATLKPTLIPSSGPHATLPTVLPGVTSSQKPP